MCLVRPSVCKWLQMVGCLGGLANGGLGLVAVVWSLCLLPCLAYLNKIVFGVFTPFPIDPMTAEAEPKTRSFSRVLEARWQPKAKSQKRRPMCKSWRVLLTLTLGGKDAS